VVFDQAWAERALVELAGRGVVVEYVQVDAYP
jgi:hypothetical protein